MRSGSTVGTARFWIRSIIGGVFAVCLAAGGLLGAFTTTASATTSAVTLSMTSGVFGVHGNTPTALPTPASITGHENSTTGNISAATLAIPAWHESNTGSSETIHLYESTAGSGTGTINYLGDVTYSDTLTVNVHITSPLSFTCNARPVHIVLSSSAPYNTSTHDVTLTESNFTIPNFTTCGIPTSTLNSKFSGSSGNVLTLNLHGTLTEPPAPAVTSTTVISSTTPASPQLHGTSVAIKATVKKSTGAAATTATGTMQFKSGTTTLGTADVTSGSATLSTTALPAGTDHLTAIYSGSSSYKSSTSSAVSYTIAPAPSLTFSGLPSTVTGGTATPRTFTVKITNPASGLSYTHLFMNMKLAGMRGVTHTTVKLQYKDTSGTWCSLHGYYGTSGSLSGVLAGVGSSCTLAYPASFSLSAGHALTVNMRVSYPTAGYYGDQKITASLDTGTCSATTVTATTPTTGTTGCTATTPMKGSLAPTGSGSYWVVPTTPIASKITDYSLRPATTTVHKTFGVDLQTLAQPVTPGTGLAAPTGTVTYKITGTTVKTNALQSTITASSNTTLAFAKTNTLSIGKHTLVSTYAGSKVYASSTRTETFTVVAAPSGTQFTCITTGLGGAHTLPAYVTASGTVPSSAYDGSNITVTGISVTIDIDPAALATYYNKTQSKTTLGFSPSGTNATHTKITFTGATNSSLAVVGTWSGMSTTVTVSGTVGTKMTVGNDVIAFTADSTSWDCTPVSSPAPIGTVTVASSSWAVGGCTTGTVTVPNGAAYMEVTAEGGGGGGGGALAGSTGDGGTGGAGGKVTSKFSVSSGTTLSGKTGCGGSGAPQASKPANGGVSVSGWSSSGAGGQGTYCDTFFSSCGNDDGTGGSGGGSTGLCSGASSCTSATTAHVVAVAGGGGGGGESSCSGTNAGAGGQSGNAGTTATSSSKGKGLSGSSGGRGGLTGAAGGGGGANNKSTGSGNATGATGGHGGSTNWEGTSAGSGGGGAGYIGGAGGANNGSDADCSAGGGGGGGASWVATAGTTTSFGTGASGGSDHGSNGTNGSISVTFLP